MHETGFRENEDRGSRIEDRGSRIEDRGLRIEDRGSGIGDETHGLLPVATTKQSKTKGNFRFIQSGSTVYSICSQEP